MSCASPVRVEGATAPGLARQARSETMMLDPGQLSNQELAQEIALIRRWWWRRRRRCYTPIRNRAALPARSGYILLTLQSPDRTDRWLAT